MFRTGIKARKPTFKEFGFDGLIKCVFSGYEVRLCSGVDVETHELRLHPYLFPVGLGGLPTFMEGGDPTLDAKKYWNSVRRALLRCLIDRIGMAHVLGVDEDIIDRVCHGKWTFEVDQATAGKVMPQGAYVTAGQNCHLTGGRLLIYRV